MKKLNSFADLDKVLPDEKACQTFLIDQRWNGKPVCIKCGSVRKLYIINGGKLLQCADCRKTFSPKVGTIFEDSPVPLKKWFMAIYVLTAHKKGISSVQLSKDIDVTQKTAWFMLHRIRHAVKVKSFEKPLGGIVEVDETYVGGKTLKNKMVPGQRRKAVVFGMVQRQGEVRAMPIKHAWVEIMDPIIKENISPDSTLMTDELPAYINTGRTFKEHGTVNHRSHEYVRGQVHTNTIEGFWSILKRGINGIYHHVSEEHLHRYTDEYAYRYNSRSLTDPQRFEKFFEKVEGRLTYKKLVEG